MENSKNIVLIWGLTQGSEKTKEKFDLHIVRSDDGTCFGNMSEEILWFSNADDCNKYGRKLYEESLKDPNHKNLNLVNWYLANKWAVSK